MLPFLLQWNDIIILDVAAPTSLLLMCLMRFAYSCHLDAAQPAVLMLPPYNPCGCNTWWSWQHVYHCRVNRYVRGLEFMVILLLFAIFLHLFWQRVWCRQSCCNGMISVSCMLLLLLHCSWCVWCASLTLVILMAHNLRDSWLALLSLLPVKYSCICDYACICDVVHMQEERHFVVPLR